MKNIRLIILLSCFLFLVSVLVGGCDSRNKSMKEEKTLLVFCGITMITPVRELADQFEKEHGVVVKMTYGGSQDLAKSIEVNKVGDIYFPGFKKFVEMMDKKGHVVDDVQVGNNNLSLFVVKGNPKNLTGELNQLVDSKLAVVIGHEDLGSVGRESKRVLTERGIYDQVVQNAVFMASDSKGLTAAIREQKADIVLNWKAVSTLKDNSDYIDVIKIEGIQPKPLVMASLEYSEHPEMAKAFLDFCGSAHGRETFKRYGF